ncbi:autotransporter outer membrane beta-barrel domain-containing protein, partial [Neisseriaceae bacterium TC5R-5]|nr:autotransporter outer membrane beta-barrel domain-containing protein [Neisseriaceae bacterium TC5R-5]
GTDGTSTGSTLTLKNTTLTSTAGSGIISDDVLNLTDTGSKIKIESGSGDAISSAKGGSTITLTNSEISTDAGNAIKLGAGTASTVTLSGNTITSAKGNGVTSADALNLTDTGSTINIQSGSGNAISAAKDGSIIKLTNSTLSTDTGSAINLRGTGKTSTVTLANTTITTKGGDAITSAGSLNVTGDNKTSITVAGAGNGMTAATGGSDINLDGSSITTANGSIIKLGTDGTSTGSTLTLKNTTLTSTAGSGIISDDVLNLTDTDSKIDIQSGNGNAISAAKDGSVIKLTNSTLSTDTGSAINLQGTGKTSTVTLANTTITTKGGDAITSAGSLNVTGDNKTSITVAGAGNGMTAATGGSDIDLDGSSITTANGSIIKLGTDGTSTGSTLTLKNTTLTSTAGSGIISDDVLNLTDTGSKIKIQSGSGDAISSAKGGSTITLTNSEISANAGNAVTLGGGTASTVTLSSTTISSTSGNGISSAGALILRADENLSSQSTITVGGGGNAISAATGGSSIDLTNTQLSTAKGTAIGLGAGEQSTLTLRNTTVNSLAGSGIVSNSVLNLLGSNVKIDVGTDRTNSTGTAISAVGGSKLTLTGGSLGADAGNAIKLGNGMASIASLSGVNITTQSGDAIVADSKLTLTLDKNSALKSGGSGILAKVAGSQITLTGGTSNMQLSANGLGISAQGTDTTVNLSSVDIAAGSSAVALSNNAALTANSTNFNSRNANTATLALNGATARLTDSTITASGTGSSAVTLNGATATLTRGSLTASGTGSSIISASGLSNVLTLNNLEVSNAMLANVASGASLNLTANDSALNGNILFADVAQPVSANGSGITLNKSTLNGQIQANAPVSLTGGSIWTMSNSSNIGGLNISDSTINFASSEATGYRTLNINGNLTGSGTFIMSSGLANRLDDRINITGTAAGKHTLVVADTGKFIYGRNKTMLPLLTSQGGDAIFTLAGNNGQFVDVGAFRHTLEHEGNNWGLVNTSVISTGANGALGNHAAAGTLWNAQMNALVKRLGELRMGDDKGGMWARGVSKHFDVDTDSSRSFKQDINGLQVGADTALKAKSGQIYLGGMVGVADSKQDFGANDSGQVKSTLLGAYATYIDRSGFYVDSLLKYNWLRNSHDYSGNLGQPISSNYNNNGYAFDVEIGQRVTLKNSWFVEPQLELTYTHTASASYVNSIGLEVAADAVNSLEGRVGALVGKTLPTAKNMSMMPYMKASVVHDFSSSSKVRVDDTTFENESIGSRLEIGIGSAFQLTKKTKASADLEYAKGSKVTMPWALNLGIRHLW